MRTFIKSLITAIILIPLFLICAIFAPTYAADGNYASQTFGEDKAHFISLTAIRENKPEGTSINYLFTGNQSNFETWSGQMMTENGQIDIANLDEIKNSSQIKVKIVFSSSNNSSPQLKGYTLKYEVGDTREIKEQSTTINSLVNGETTSTTSIKKLVSAGVSVWPYLGAAVLASIIAAVIIFRKK